MVKYKHSKTLGNEAENIIESWLQLAGVQFKKENTQLGRRKGSVDFEGDLICFDVKKCTDFIPVSYKSESHDIKWSQIEYLSKNKHKVSGLIITEDCKTFYFLSISTFMYWWSNSTLKHIKMREIENIGVKMVSYEELKKLVT